MPSSVSTTTKKKLRPPPQTGKASTLVIFTAVLPGESRAAIILTGEGNDGGRERRRHPVSAGRRQGAGAQPRERRHRVPAAAPGAADLLSRAHRAVRGPDRPRLELQAV